MVKLVEIQVELMQQPEVHCIEGQPYLCHGNKYPLWNGDGIRVRPVITVENNFVGHFYITSIAYAHSMKFDYLRGGTGHLNLDTPHHDGENEGHDRIFQIDDTSGENKDICFKDTVRRELMTEVWKNLSYSINFSTYFQYSEGPVINKDLRMLGGFDWELKAELANNNGVWEMNDRSLLTEMDVINTIRIVDEPAIYPNIYPNLWRTVNARFIG